MIVIVFSLIVCIFAADNFYPANDPAVWTVGRTRVNTANDSLSFDWESTQMYINVGGANYVNIHIAPSGGVFARFLVQVDGWEETSFWIRDEAVSQYLIASDLGGQAVQIRVISVLEPAFENANPGGCLTFYGFSTDGKAQSAGPKRTRKIELVGDSISAGFGSRGYSGAPDGCPVTGYTSGNPYTYNWMLAEYFNADLVPIAWSGKGMYENCCDNGETMPSYYLQTLGGDHYTTDWDFNRFVPDTIIINLGTNDFGHDSGPVWEKNFQDTFVDFVANATTRYKNPKMPIFVAQGPMNCGTPLKNSLDIVVSRVNAAGGKAVYLNLCGPPNDGCGGHPGVQGHMQMFEQGKTQIATVMGW